MSTVAMDRLPSAVREIENLSIPLSDGCRLAARLWLPDGAERRPVPAILEYIPYRKRDGTRWRDEPMHRYFAGHGTRQFAWTFAAPESQGGVSNRSGGA